jgi:putative transposase
LELEEGILCDLNRAVQKGRNSQCLAFRPRLNLVGTQADTKQTGQGPVDRKTRHQSIQEIMASDKFNYQKALALQKLSQDPDGVFIELKYHLVWNVRHRRPVFLPEKEYVDFILKKINSCGKWVGDMARLLWLAPDHLHVYIESDGKKSIEIIIRKIKPFLTKEFLANFPEIKKIFDQKGDLWDKSYFTETLG